jgi:conserved oligomeric Golgi complex subunit 6
MASEVTSEANALAAGGTGKDPHQHSILTAKVSRALEVRTDTPAMKAALDALAHLPDHQDEMFTVDSRSVRVAIEQDALQQALLLQGELRTLLDTVVQLRQGVTETAAIAHRVSDAIHINVISNPTASRMRGAGVAASIGMQPTSTSEVGEDDAEASTSPRSAPLVMTELVEAKNTNDALGQEQKLAALLSDSFLQRNLARKRLDAVHAFLEKFDLSDEDARLLDHYAFDDVEASTSQVNGMAFLIALERVRVIRKELGRTFGRIDLVHHHRLAQQDTNSRDNRLGASSALRMMETLAQKQERAYERLYHWLQKFLQLHSHGTPGNSAPSVDEDHLDEALSNPFVRRSLYALRNVPAFYSHLLELIAASRRSEETRRFLLALTSGYGGLPPIEMRAHDAVVYVGDMLAFCFRAFSIEADVAKGLFYYKPEDDGPDGGEEKDDSPRTQEEEEEAYLVEKPLSATDILSLSMSGVARPLKSRILQVVANLSRRSDGDDDDDDGGHTDLEEEGSSARSRLAQLYEMSGLLLFYASALEKSVDKLQKHDGRSQTADKENTPDEKLPIVAVILECLGEATNAYEASLRVYGAMLEQLNVLTGDPEANLAHSMIVRLVKVREASPGFAPDAACPPAFQRILSLEWACIVLVEAALPTSKSLDDAMSLKQCIAVARNAEKQSDEAKMLIQKVEEMEASLIDVLVEKETADVLDLCGLGTLAMALKSFQGLRVDGMLMVTHPGLSPEDVEAAIKEFYASLYSPPLPSFESVIKDPNMRKIARNKIAANVCSKYEELYSAMTSPDCGGYDDLSYLGHTPTQVKTLFSV